MEYRMNTGGEQEVSQFATVGPRGNGNGGIIHTRRRVVSHAISGMGTIAGVAGDVVVEGRTKRRNWGS